MSGGLPSPLHGMRRQYSQGVVIRGAEAVLKSVSGIARNAPTHAQVDTAAAIDRIVAAYRELIMSPLVNVLV